MGSCMPPQTASRLEPARLRARRARLLLTAFGAVAFAATAALARAAHPGHHKAPDAPLGAPDRFVEIVRQNQLEAGIIAPAEAPPGAESAPS